MDKIITYASSKNIILRPPGSEEQGMPRVHRGLCHCTGFLLRRNDRVDDNAGMPRFRLSTEEEECSKVSKGRGGWEKEISVGMILNNIREKNLWEKGALFSLSKNSGCGANALSNISVENKCKPVAHSYGISYPKTQAPLPAQQQGELRATPLSDRHPLQASGNFTVIPFIGIHPWDSAEADEKTINTLEEVSAKTGAFIGEFGFDKLKGADKDKQLYIFKSCLDIALKSEKPFTIHCVRSWGLLAEELQKAKNRIRAPFIIHAYNGSAEVMKTITKLGGYLSFGLERYGAFSQKAADSILKIDLKRLLLETDFTCHSKQSQSDDGYGEKYLKRLLAVYNEAASVLKTDITELSGAIEENGKIFKAYTINRK
ncbi:MAG: TatD family hydrolase [Spirochaetaceae bacterium]|nr:TatD family hydrolase [Spirochaetaceae bacterium]